MLGKAAAIALALLLVSPAAANASGWRFDDRDSHPRRHHDSQTSWSHWVSSHDDEDSDDSEDSDSEDQDSPDSDEPVVAPGGAVVVTGTEKSIQAALTGYSYQDNTPPGSATICCTVLHAKAGGTGTFEDPLTTAVAGSGSSMIFKAGTRFYIPTIKRYVIVEDSGASSDGLPHLDVWVGGQGHSKSDSDACMNSFTGNATIIQNPAAGHPVTAGELTTSGGCKI